MGTRRTRRRARAASIAALLAGVVALATAACGDQDDGPPRVATITPVAAGLTAVPGAGERATLSGTLTLDGAPLESEFLGARVIRDGLVTACQHSIPPVVGGDYAIQIAADAEVRGCGAPGAEILLWAFVNDGYVYSSETAPWPGDGATATFDASFSSGATEGASKPVTQFKGRLFDRSGNELPGGTVIEAYVGDVLCGLVSLRYGSEFEHLYTLIVAGPESIPGCAEGATLTFRLDGELAVETAVNDLGRGNEGHEVDLTLE